MISVTKGGVSQTPNGVPKTYPDQTAAIRAALRSRVEGVPVTMSEAKVQVAVRARPLSQRELEMESPVVLEMKGKSTSLRKTTDDVIVGQTREKVNEFVYDYSYWSLDPNDPHFVPQEQVFNDLGKTVLEAAFEGYNACVFAYGQTGSGKTFTMMGTERAPGLIPRICETLFDRTVSGSLKKVSYKVEASFMEIYNEMVRDLLLPAQKNAAHRLKVRKHPKHGPYVENLSKHPVPDYQSVEELMNLGNSNRVTAATKMNDASSRSHAIFTITFTQATYSADLPCETVSKINLVDLAGSERASATGAEGIRLTEGGNINRSLVSLGNVISALAEQSSHPSTQRHIPYRDSVLTWLLKDSLGGNSKTIMIATVSPAMCNYGETLSTLRYASRAKNIVNKPVVNEDPNVRLIRDLRAEIKRLKMIITDGNFDVSQPGSTKTVTELFSEDIQRKENQIAQLTKTWAGKWEGYQNIIEDSNLALHSEGIKMTVASELPHFLAVDDDALGTGVVIYHLQKSFLHMQHEHTSIGAAGSSPRPDIELNGLDIESPHCVVEHVSGKVYLTPHDGTTSVNTDLVTSKIKLTHGDIVQFGSSTVFRFNHPQEAAEMKEKDETRARGRLLELSPVSPKDMLEEQRLAIERHYEEKLESMRREMESRNQHEKERLMKELEKLKISSSVEIPSEQVGDEGAPLGSPGAEDDPYQVMKSIGYQPIDSRRQRTTSIRIKDITGGEVAAHSYPSADSPVPALRFSPSPSPDTPVQSHELPLLSPATGQHNAVPERVSDSPIDPELNKILETYEILHDTCGIPSVQHTPPMDTFDGVPDFTTSSQYDLGYGSRNMAQSRADSCLSASCPQGPSTFQPDGDTVDEQQDDLRTVEQELDNVGELVRDGVVYRRKRGDTERVRKLAKKLTRDVDQLRKEKDDYSVENAELKEKLEKLSSPLQDQSESVLDYRRRSYALPESELSSATKKLRRSQSVGEQTTRLLFSIDHHYLRGWGLTSYHVYEVSIVLGKEKWTVHKRYQDFQRLHMEMSRRYPQLSTLSLPPSRWIGHRTEAFVQQRRVQLQNYMQSIVAVLRYLKNSPLTERLGKRLTKKDLIEMSSFFDDSGNVFATVS